MLDTQEAPHTVVTEFKAVDRCDRNISEAAQMGAIKDDKELWFCNHHGEKYRAALEEQGWFVYHQDDFANPVPMEDYIEEDA